MFNNCDVLKSYVAHIDDIYKDFTEYKSQVPVTGAIILDETYELVSSCFLIVCLIYLVFKVITRCIHHYREVFL